MSALWAPTRPWAFLAAAAMWTCISYYAITYTLPDGTSRGNVLRARQRKRKVAEDKAALTTYGNAFDPALVKLNYPSLGSTMAEADFFLVKNSFSEVFESFDSRRGCIDGIFVPSGLLPAVEMPISCSRGVGQHKTLFNGLYTGHCGIATAWILRDALDVRLAWNLSHLNADADEDAIQEAMRTAFTQLDDEIMGEAKKRAEIAPIFDLHAFRLLAPTMSGACALVTVLDLETSILRVALTGDSRAVLGSWCPETKTYAADTLTSEQTGFNEREVQRLEALHPGEMDRMINHETGRFMGGLRVTRCFGDHRWKWPAPLVRSVAEKFFGFDPLPGDPADHPTPPYLTAEPEISTRRIKARDFLILGSAGFWYLMTSEMAVECVARWLAAREAGRAEDVVDADPGEPVPEKCGYPYWEAAPQYFAIEDLQNAAVCLAKNALGGSRRAMYRGMLTLRAPLCEVTREEIGLQVVFFDEPPGLPLGGGKS